jgi:hypothetical protein
VACRRLCRVALLEQGLKLALNLYRAWVSEDAVRGLRRTLEDVQEEAGPDATGTHTAMVVAEAEPIGGFVGMAISEPLLQAGILVSVMGYMAYLEPWTLGLSAALLIPQALFVPPMQRAINRRAEKRIKVLRRVGGDIVESGAPQDARIERVFELNMGIYKLKYSMNLLMNFMHNLATAVALGVGGWFAIQHRIDGRHVVAVVSGLGQAQGPVGRPRSTGAASCRSISVKYRLFADAWAGGALQRPDPSRYWGHERSLYRPGGQPDRLGRGDPQGLPQARQEAPSGPQPGRQGGRGQVQGDLPGQRDLVRRREAPALRRGRDRRQRARKCRRAASIATRPVAGRLQVQRGGGHESFADMGDIFEMFRQRGGGARGFSFGGERPASTRRLRHRRHAGHLLAASCRS